MREGVAGRLAGFALLSLGLHAGAGAWILHARAPAADVRETVVESQPVLSGETFDLPTALSPDPVPVPNPVPDLEGIPTDTTRQSHGAVTSASTPTSGLGSSTTETEPKLFGAVGERGSIDLATAFGRGFSQAASADPAWLGAPLGDAGRVEVTLEIDDTGTLVRAELGVGASPPLEQGLRRAIALVKGRTFTSPQSIVVLRIAARVSPDTVHDHFEIGVADDGRGAHFVRPETHRRIDLDIGP
jgi:hypothetical protein